jgi:glyoxylase-like metal-dependent hydrolase (beta-lactamase superfamily II)
MISDQRPFTVTGHAQRRAWADRVLPPIEHVREGVWSVPILFPESPVRYTNCYLVIGDDRRALIIDPGWNSDNGYDQLVTGLSTAGIDATAIAGIVVTHLHPDHIGMAKRLADETGAWVAMHREDLKALRRFPADPDEAYSTDRNWLSALGVPEDQMDSLVTSHRITRDLQRISDCMYPLDDGELLPFNGRTIRVVFTPGHTAGHICVADESSGLLFTGDHVLPRITPNVSLTALDTGRDPLAEYNQSLKRVQAWDAFDVCPAHEYRFFGLTNRVMQLMAHHAERADEIVAAVASYPGATAWEIASRISWSHGWNSLNGINLRSALGETIAHLHFLANTARLVWAGADGTALRAHLAPAS